MGGGCPKPAWVGGDGGGGQPGAPIRWDMVTLKDRHFPWLLLSLFGGGVDEIMAGLTKSRQAANPTASDNDLHLYTP